MEKSFFKKGTKRGTKSMNFRSVSDLNVYFWKYFQNYCKSKLPISFLRFSFLSLCNFIYQDFFTISKNQKSKI